MIRSAQTGKSSRDGEAEQGSDSTINVVILAGGQNTIPLYDGYVPGPKALIPYAGKPSIEYVLEALSKVAGIGKICIEGPREMLQKTLSHRQTESGEQIAIVDGGATFLDSLVVGLEHFRSSRRVLFVTADLPLITPEAVRDFLQASAALPSVRDQNLRIAAVPRTAYQGPYRNFTKPFNRFRDVQICHGNLFIADTDLVENEEVRKRVPRLYDGRKSVLSRLAFNWQIALAYLIGVDLLHALTLRRMAEIATKYLGIGIIPVLVAHPEITIDVDDGDDYEFVRERLQETAGSRTE